MPGAGAPSRFLAAAAQNDTSSRSRFCVILSGSKELARKRGSRQPRCVFRLFFPSGTFKESGEGPSPRRRRGIFRNKAGAAGLIGG
jgi:hypothetical protein